MFYLLKFMIITASFFTVLPVNSAFSSNKDESPPCRDHLASVRTTIFSFNTDLQILKAAFASSKHRNFILDYDGVLRLHQKNPREAKPDPDLMQILTAIDSDSRNYPYINSARPKESLVEWFDGLNRWGLMSDHGLFMRLAGETEWQDLLGRSYAWKDLIRGMIETAHAENSGTRFAERTAGFAWTHRGMEDQEAGVLLTQGLAGDIRAALEDFDVQVKEGRTSLEIFPAGINKGVPLQRILNQPIPEDAIFIVMGDEAEDEIMFQTVSEVSENVWTFRIGPGETAARFRLEQQTDVIKLLKLLIQD